MAVTESILEEAQRLIHGDRNKSYGHPRENFAAIAALWNAYLDHAVADALEPQDIANMMILMKVARINNGVYHRDSVTDIAGYAGTIERLQEPPTPVGTIQSGLLDVQPEGVVDRDDLEDYVAKYLGTSLQMPVATQPLGWSVLTSRLDPLPVRPLQGFYPGGLIENVPVRAVRLTKYLTSTKWQSETTGLIFWHVDGQWWYMDPQDTAEDPWLDFPGDDVPENEGPFVPYKGE